MAMTWVRTEPHPASANIVTSHSLNPQVQHAHLALYRAIQFGESPLSRLEREAIAVVVSAANDCHY
jgi:alkylhydroperoxidase family enzyme